MPATGTEQISMLALASVEKMRALGARVNPGAFAENLTIADIDIPALRIGEQIAVGEALLEVTQIGKECHTRCAIYQQVGDCVMPREGVFARVRVGGDIRVGDAVSVLPCIPPEAGKTTAAAGYRTRRRRLFALRRQ